MAAFAAFCLLLPACRAPKRPERAVSGIEYRLALEPDLDLLAYRGEMDLAFPNPSKRNLDSVPLYLYPNIAAPRGSRFLVVEKVSADGKPASFKDQGRTIVVKLERPVPPKGTVRLHAVFKGRLGRFAAGEDDLLVQGLSQAGEILGQMLGASTPTSAPADYGTLAFGKGIYSFGNWYPQLPAWFHDSFTAAAAEESSPLGEVGFSDAADVELHLLIPDKVVAAATGHLVATKKEGNDRQRLTYRAKKVRSVAVELSRRFKTSERKVGEVTIRSFYLPEDEKAGKRALETGAAAFDYYEQSFGPYPWKDLSIVEAPLRGGAGGVEFSGLVTCSTGVYSDILSKLAPWLQLAESLGGANLPPMGKALTDMLPFVVAHEVSHQWWNALVGSDSRGAPFMDEALANFSAVRFFGHSQGVQAAKEQRLMQLALPYQAYRTIGGADLPVASKASEFPGAMAYSAIVYGKGALFFEELVKRYGEKPVMSALARYCKAGRHRVMESDDLRRALRTIAPDNEKAIDDLYRRWLIETHGDEDIGRTIPGIAGGGLDLDGDLGNLLQKSLSLLLGEDESTP